MFSPATAEDFLTALKEYFHFPPEYEQTETFVSDIKGFNSRTKLPAAHADSQYSVFSIRTPVAVYLIDRHGSFTTHISIDQEHGFMAHVPAEQMNIQTLHRHTCYELVYILRGSLDFLIEGTHRRYQQGEACLLNTNVRHVEENISDYTAIYPVNLQAVLQERHF